MISEAAAASPIVAALQQESSSWLLHADVALGELTLEVQPDRIVHVCRFLRDERHFERVSTITAVDRYPAEPRFELVYHLHSLSLNERVRVKTRVPSSNPSLESATAVWVGANWYEREVFDLFGIEFRNHPKLERILMPEGWDGHPLRKDYPVHGHRYDYAGAEGGNAE
jgi:NADH-quinone oxidoreductase subunit C